METFNYCLLDFEISKKIELLCEKELYIWGAAEKGWQIQRTLKRCGILIEAFCDSDSHKWGDFYENIPIISPYRFLERYKKNMEVCVISCVFREKELLRLLEELKVNNILLVSYWGIKNALVANRIVLEVQNNLPIYDGIWEYKKRNYLKENFGLSFEVLERLETYNSDIIWNYQSGKVASTTIYNRLKQAGILCLHMHTLNYPSHVLGESLKKIWAKKVNERLSQKIKIITSVREPLSRDYSAFWQPFKMERTYLMPLFNKDFQKMYEDYISLIVNGYENACKLLLETMECVWVDEFEWFNREIREIFGIDVYAYPFDREKGYGIIRDKNVQIFIFKVEKLDAVIPELNTFLGKEIQSRSNANEAIDTLYWLAYDKFKDELMLPSKYVEHYYKGNSYMDHFYTKEEQSFFLSKWSKHIKNDA